jgi:phosphonate transport system substrate-binding protein
VTDLVLGAVAYAPKVATIWTGFRSWFRARGVDLDFVLYSNYERQVADLLDGHIDLAWNSPLAWVRARRLAAARGLSVAAVAMRDTDQDLRSLVVTVAGSGVQTVDQLADRVCATGAMDSPQATLIPLSVLRAHGLREGKNLTVHRHDIGVGLHGDHIGGEREAVVALVSGAVDAACLVDENMLLFAREGLLPPDGAQILAASEAYDHCNLTAGPSAPTATLTRFRELLLAMEYADDEVRPLLDLEGLKAWRPGRTVGYASLERAVDENGFYGPTGDVRARDYRP